MSKSSKCIFVQTSFEERADVVGSGAFSVLPVSNASLSEFVIAVVL